MAAHFGSPAGELAVCVQTVGLAARTDLGTLCVTGKVAGVAEVARRMAGTAPAPRGVAFSGGAWWCVVAPDWLIVLCEAGLSGRLLSMMHGHTRQIPGVEVSDESAAWAAIAVVGRGAMRILAALGALADGDVRFAPPFGPVTIAGANVHVLLQSEARALLVSDSIDAERVWRSVKEAGRPFGLSVVGAEAVHRFSLLDWAAGSPGAGWIGRGVSKFEVPLGD